MRYIFLLFLTFVLCQENILQDIEENTNPEADKKPNEPAQDPTKEPA